MVRVGRLLAILVVSTTCASAYADGSAAPDSAKKAPLQPPEEEKVAPTGLIIAGVALAAFAVLLLVGKRKKSGPQLPQSQLAEVLLIVESDERATVWTQPSLKLPTDRLGEVVLHLPVGRHDVHVQIGSEQYTRSIQVDSLRRMRVPINIAKERITRTNSGDIPPSAPAAGRAMIADLPVPQKPQTSMARAYPDSGSQGKLGAQLAGLIDVELDNPLKPAATFSPAPAKELDLSLDPGAGGDLGAIDFSALATPSKPPALTLDLGGGDAVDFDVPLTPPPVAVPLPARPRDDAAALPPTPARPSPLRDVASPKPMRGSPLRDVPVRSRPQTGPLEGIVRASPVATREPVLPKAPPSSARPPMDISLDDIARPVRSGKTVPPPISALLDDLPDPAAKPKATLDFDELDDVAASMTPVAAPAALPSGGSFELAPPERAAAVKVQARAGLPSVSDFALGDAMPARPVAIPVELPKVSAASVSDLSLDEDDVPVHRIPTAGRTSSNRKVPSVADFALDDLSLELPVEPVSKAAAKPPPMRPVRPSSSSDLDDILAPPGAPIATAPPPRAPAPPATSALGDRYRKGTAIGPGPIGQLFRGRDEDARRDVMIEEVPPDLTLPTAPQALATLKHANLVQFYDYVVDATKGYLVTEVVEGKSVKQLLVERGSLSSLEAIGIVDQVCAALAAAHDRGVFHRCVRPACILMSGRSIKLTGFLWSAATRTLLYTAPELAAGGAPDARGDLYSVGMTLAELLSGKVPAAGKLDLPSDVPRNLVGLVRKLVSREPTIRPASAKAVREAFSGIF